MKDKNQEEKLKKIKREKRRINKVKDLNYHSYKTIPS